ncbi:MAG: carboxypeptidase-like regulatory domain-containing protein, partial [Sphingobacteriales bacterium]
MKYLASLFLIFIPALLPAQQVITIKKKAEKETGIGFSSLSIKNKKTSTTIYRTTDSSGKTIVKLDPGNYEIAATAIG